MRRLSLVVAAVALAACGPKEQPAADTSAAAAPPPGISLSDVAGTWTAKVMRMDSDSVILTYELVASADPTAWTIILPGRPPVPLRAMADGDSIVTDAGPYESALRKGVQVTTHGVFRLVNGELVGQTTAHYDVKTADSVVTLRQVATKKM
ncbi:MAG: hypothetical protein ACRENH_03730 [Gemmatimonadaceae bacterium]